MLFKDYEQMYIDYCDEEIMRRIVIAKRKYLKEEKRCKMQCTLYEREIEDADDVKEDHYVGDADVMLEDFLPLEETVENPKIAKSMKLLSPKERKVVSLRLDDDLAIKQINIIIGTKRKSGTSDVFRRAVRKIRKDINEDGEEK